ncbi:MAG TPA: serine/threonine-protein kinase, partial [Blastocatellia bacterium]|nr:serine/threonine-protein kinase [Blastocatellia bacterium]
MNSEQWRKIDRLFDTLIEIDPSRRPRILNEVCGDDDQLRAELESLLSAHTNAQGFIETLSPSATADLFGSANSQPILGSSLSHYRVLSLLGSGGMGEVYLAVDTRLGRNVALKLLPQRYEDEKRIDRFRQEASAASSLNHPNILTVYEIGEHQGRHFIATEHVEGETLRQQIDWRMISTKYAVDVASQVAGALAAAHAAGIVHRDVKPENLMVRPDGLVKVLDFGIAKLSRQSTSFAAAGSSVSSVETAGVVFGTVSYMSPEQVRGQDVDSRSDLFSLGVVMYEMLAGARPFRGNTPGEIVAALLEREAPPLSAATASIPAELERIVTRSLAKSANARYQSASELQADLKALARKLGDDLATVVLCFRCGEGNPEHFAFCGRCGAALGRICTICGGEVTPSSQSCSSCGHRVEESGSRPEVASTTRIELPEPSVPRAWTGTERRNATVLCAAISG